MRLAVEAVTPVGSIMAVLRAVQERYPSVRIELSAERLAGAADALREARAEVVVATRLGTATGKLEAAHFRTVRILPVARRDHPVATCGTPIPPALLRAHPQIVLRDSAQDPASPPLNVLEGGVRWSVTDVAAKKDVILAGMGWGGLPEHVVADALASGELVRLEVPRVRGRRDGAVRDAAPGPPARRGRAVLWDELVRGGAARATNRLRRRA